MSTVRRSSGPMRELEGELALAIDLLLGQIELAQAEEGFSQHSADVVLDGRLIGERSRRPSGRERQCFAHQRLAAACLLRRRREQQVVDEKALDRARAPFRGARAIALGERDEQSGRQADEGEARRCDREPMPGDELARAIEPRAGERLDRKAGERAADVVGERGDRERSAPPGSCAAP